MNLFDKKYLRREKKIVRANLVKSAIGGRNKIGACRARAKLDEKRLCIFTVWCSSGEWSPICKCLEIPEKIVDLPDRINWAQVETRPSSILCVFAFCPVERRRFYSGRNLRRQANFSSRLSRRERPVGNVVHVLDNVTCVEGVCFNCEKKCWAEVFEGQMHKLAAYQRLATETTLWREVSGRALPTLTCCLDEGEFSSKESWHPCNSQTIQKTTHQHFNDTSPDRLLQQTTFSHGQFKVHRHICRLATTSLVRSVGHWPRHKWHTGETSDRRQKSNFVCFRRRSSKEQSLKRTEQRCVRFQMKAR